MYVYMFASVYIHGNWSDEERIWKIENCLSTALAKHHGNGDTSMVTEIVNLFPIM